MVDLQELALMTEADLVAVDKSQAVTKLALNPEEAKPDELTLIFADKVTKALKSLEKTQAQIIIMARSLKDKELIQVALSSKQDVSLLWVDKPRYALGQIIDLFGGQRKLPQAGVHASAVIEEDVELDASASIGAMVSVLSGTKIGAGTKVCPRVSVGADVTIGQDCLIHSGVVIEDGVQLGDRVTIHANAVIGSDGYSYVTREASNLEKMRSGDFNLNMDRQIQEKISSIGSVVIHDDVEIGSNTVIDRGTIGSTVIGEGTKIDNLVQIAHNVQIGKDCLIIANTGIAGSVKVGDRATIAGACGIGDGVEIGNDAVIAAFSAVHANVDPFLPMLGVPALPYGEFMSRQKQLARLPKMAKDIKELKTKISDQTEQKDSKQLAE